MSVPRPAMLVAMVTLPLAARLGDDLGFPLVVLRIQHIVRDLPRRFKHVGESFSDLAIDVVPHSTGPAPSPCSPDDFIGRSPRYFSRSVR